MDELQGFPFVLICIGISNEYMPMEISNTNYVTIDLHVNCSLILDKKTSMKINP